jgi:hypothetical protein
MPVFRCPQSGISTLSEFRMDICHKTDGKPCGTSTKMMGVAFVVNEAVLWTAR